MQLLSTVEGRFAGQTFSALTKGPQLEAQQRAYTWKLYMSAINIIALFSTALLLTALRSASRALPGTDGQVPGEKHVHQVLQLVGDLEAESLADHHVPRRTEFFVQLKRSKL